MSKGGPAVVEVSGGGGPRNREMRGLGAYGGDACERAIYTNIAAVPLASAASNVDVLITIHDQEYKA